MTMQEYSNKEPLSSRPQSMSAGSVSGRWPVNIVYTCIIVFSLFGRLWDSLHLQKEFENTENFKIKNPLYRFPAPECV